MQGGFASKLKYFHLCDYVAPFETSIFPHELAHPQMKVMSGVVLQLIYFIFTHNI